MVPYEHSLGRILLWISNHLELQKKHNNTVSYMVALLNSPLICSAHFNICGWMKEAECEYSIYCSCSCITGILHSGWVALDMTMYL